MHFVFNYELILLFELNRLDYETLESCEFIFSFNDV